MQAAPDEYRALLSAHGFEVIDVIMEDPQCTGHTVWLAQKRLSLFTLRRGRSCAIQPG